MIVPERRIRVKIDVNISYYGPCNFETSVAVSVHKALNYRKTCLIAQFCVFIFLACSAWFLHTYSNCEFSFRQVFFSRYFVNKLLGATDD